MTREELTTCVRRGIELLDCLRPGWRTDVDWSTLDQRSCIRCALGQLYGTYLRGVSQLWPEEGALLVGIDCQYGFSLPTNSVDENDVLYSQLTQIWCDLGPPAPAAVPVHPAHQNP